MLTRIFALPASSKGVVAELCHPARNTELTRRTMFDPMHYSICNRVRHRLQLDLTGPNMNRRAFTFSLSLLPLLTNRVYSANSPVAGTDFMPLPTPMPVAVPGKIEVIEFFGYWCPHCNAFETPLEPWAKSLPADVNFRRIPVAWQEAQVPYQKLFFALEAMGVKNDVHPKVFKAFHEQRQRLDGDAGITGFATAIGVDKTKLAEAMNSFSVASKIKVASQQAGAYQIEGVPTFIVNGKYSTSPEMAKGEVQALRVVDALILQARAQR